MLVGEQVSLFLCNIHSTMLKNIQVNESFRSESKFLKSFCHFWGSFAFDFICEIKLQTKKDGRIF